MIDLSNITRDKGTVQVAVYGSEADFRKAPPRGLSEPARKSKLLIVVKNLPDGEYAVMAFPDLNGDDKLHTNIGGMPKEPWGGSLQVKSVLGAPGWNDVKFKLPAAGLTVDIGMWRR